MADKKFSDFTVQTDLSNFDGLVGFDGANNYKITPANLEANLNLDNFATGKLAIAQGGTNSTTAQAAIDALTNVSGATLGHVLTKDGSGNATFQAPSGGGDLKWSVIFNSNSEFAGTPGSTPTDWPFQGYYNAATSMASGSQRLIPYFIPFDCTLTGMYWKYCGEGAVEANSANDISDLFIYTYTGGDTKMALPAGWDTTGDNATAIYSQLKNESDDGTWPQKSDLTLNRTFSAGDIIMPFNRERLLASIGPTSAQWSTLQLIFEAT